MIEVVLPEYRELFYNDTKIKLVYAERKCGKTRYCIQEMLKHCMRTDSNIWVCGTVNNKSQVHELILMFMDRAKIKYLDMKDSIQLQNGTLISFMQKPVKFTSVIPDLVIAEEPELTDITDLVNAVSDRNGVPTGHLVITTSKDEVYWDILDKIQDMHFNIIRGFIPKGVNSITF